MDDASVIKDDHHPGVIPPTPESNSSCDEEGLGSTSLTETGANLGVSRIHSQPLSVNPVRSATNAVPVAVDSNDSFSWPDESEDASALSSPVQLSAEATPSMTSPGATAGVYPPRSIQGYAAPPAVDVLNSEEHHRLGSLDAFDSRVLAMTLRDMANANECESLDPVGVSTLATVAINTAANETAEDAHTPKEDARGMQAQPSAANGDSNPQIPSVNTLERSSSVPAATSDPSDQESSASRAPNTSSLVSPEHSALDRPPYMGERSWDCSLCSTSNVDLRSSSGAGVPQWCRLCQIPRGHRDPTLELKASLDAATIATSSTTHGASAAASVAMTSAGIAGAVVAAATAEAAAAGSASVAAAQEEATTAAAAAAAAASVAAGVHTVAVNQDTTAGLGRGATSGGISTSGAERPTIFTEAALARRLHVQGLKVHERRRATALATALATTKLYWLAIGAMLDDAVLADQQLLALLRGKEATARSHAQHSQQLRQSVHSAASAGLWRRPFDVEAVDPHGFGFAVPATNSAYSKSSTKTSSHGNAADATNTIDPALMEHAWLQLAPFVRAQCDAQTNIANAHLTLAENLCLIGDRIDASIRHGASLATRLRQEAGRDLALVAGAEKTAQAALAAVVFYSSASDQADADDELARAELLGATPEASGLGPGTRNVSAAMEAFARSTSNSGASSPSPSSPRRVNSSSSKNEDNGSNASNNNTSSGDSSSNDVNDSTPDDTTQAPSLAAALAAKKPTLVNKGSIGSIANSGATTSTKGQSSSSSDPVQNLLGVGAGGRGDVWLCDARYRLAVSAVQWAWRKASSLLAELFQQAHAHEVARRRRTHEAVAQVVEAERLLWSQHLPTCLESTSQALTIAARKPSFSSTPSASPAAAASVRSLVRRYAQEIQRKKATAGQSNNTSSNSNNSSGNGSIGPRGTKGSHENTIKDGHREVKPVLFALPPPPEERSYDERAALKKQGSFGIGDDDVTGGTGDSSAAESEMHLLPLEAPMTSPLVLKSGVIERRQEGLMFSAWLPVLAVLTADRAMHLFQLPKGTPLAMSPAEAFAVHVSKGAPSVVTSHTSSSQHPGTGPSNESLPKPTPPGAHPETTPGAPVAAAQSKADLKAAAAAAKAREDELAAEAAWVAKIADGDGSSKALSEVATPHRTVRLENSVAKWKPPATEPKTLSRTSESASAVFVVEEAVLDKSLFGRRGEKIEKLTLRCQSTDEMVDWCVLIKGGRR